MSENQKEGQSDHWSGKLLKVIPNAFYLMIAVWVLLGVVPFVLAKFSLPSAGQIGDTFGMANSFFSGLGFAIAGAALLIQILQSKESADQRAEDVKLANENIRLQLEIREDEKRKGILECLQKVNRDIVSMQGACDPADLFGGFSHMELSEPERAEKARQQAERIERFRSCKLEITADALAVRLVLGDTGNMLAEWIDEFYEIAISDYADEEFELGLLSDKSEEIREEIERVWKVANGE
jgi:hypothetical protein